MICTMISPSISLAEDMAQEQETPASEYAGADLLDEISQENAWLAAQDAYTDTSEDASAKTAYSDSSSDISMQQLDWNAFEAETGAEEDFLPEEAAADEAWEEDAVDFVDELSNEEFFEDEMFPEEELSDEALYEEEFETEFMTEEILEEDEELAASSQVSLNGFLFELDSEAQTAALVDYLGNDTELNIPDTVTTGSTDYPVVSIGSMAFYGLNGYPLNISEKEPRETTPAITSVKIPATVTTIQYAAFAGCYSLEDVEFKSGSALETIEGRAFQDDAQLTSLDIPETVSEIQFYALSNTGLTEVVFPQNLEQIEHGLLESSAVERVTIPASVKTIGSCAFQNCWNLQSVGFGRGSTLTQVGTYAFAYSSLNSIVLPDSVEQIGAYAFEGCQNLGEIRIPASCKGIWQYAFGGCMGLKKVTFGGNSLTTIAPYAFSFTGFSTISLPSSVTKLSSCVFQYSKLEKFNVPATVTAIEYAAFAGCSKLTDLTFASGSKISVIPKLAFFETSLSSVKLPLSVKTIEDKAFTNMKNLKQIHIDPGVTKIGTCALGYMLDGKRQTKVSGFIIGGKRGTTAEAYAKKNGFTFVPDDPYLKLDVSGKRINLQIKKSFTPKVTSIYPGDKVISWVSNNPRIAPVSSTGTVIGKAIGTAVITAKTKYGATSSFTVIVKKIRTSKIKGVPKKLTLKKGKKKKLKAVKYPSNSDDSITFKTSNKKIVTVSKKGLLTAKKKGKAVITVKSGKKKVKCTITVK